jgi:anti-anti-sigma regulatory factor
VATVKVHDRAGEFRIEIVGRLAGECVHEIRTTWKNVLREAGTRRFTVDISRLSSYDSAGRKLLHDMYRHGTQIAAGTPLSLVFLSEISTPVGRGPAVVHEVPAKHPEKERNTLARRHAAGQ